MSWSESIASVEKSDVMEQHYSESNDPWGNRQRQLYQKVLKYGSQKVFEYFNELHKNDYREDYTPIVELYDIGCGGGNVLDTLIENAPIESRLRLGGCDISESAIKFLDDHFKEYSHKFGLIDCEELSSENPPSGLSSADIVTIVDVMYYWGNKRDYRKTLDEIWNSLPYGCIILVADSIIPYQRRSYFKSKSDCKVLEEYTDYSCPMGQLNDTNKNRYLKVKIYQKVKEH